MNKSLDINKAMNNQNKLTRKLKIKFKNTINKISRKNKIIYEDLFQYPSKSWDDIVVYKKTENKYIDYHIAIEGFIFYDNLNEGIEYFNEMKYEYYNWLVKNHYTKEQIDNAVHKSNKNLIFKTYNIEIYQNEHHVNIYLGAYSSNKLIDTYIWFNNIIEEIKKFNERKNKE